MKTISLNGAWKLRGREQERAGAAELSLTATVPGCVQLDLSRAGYLPSDLYMGENIKETERFESYEWWYERSFTAPTERENVFLVFEGVDCLAEYFLNGECIGTSENMFIAHEFEVGRYLKDGENTLTVHLRSAVLAINDTDFSVHAMMAWENGAVESALRRAPHTYGWDIMPRAVTAGLWRDVRIEVRDPIYFSQLFFKTDLTSVTAMYELSGSWHDLKNATLVFKGACGESVFEHRVAVNGKKAARARWKPADPQLWWPYGYGAPNLYEVTAEIYLGDTLVHEVKTHFGMRTVVLDRTDTTDGKNGRFRFLVNGTEILCKGSNWVPLDAFHSRDAERYERALELVRDIGCNILRCWGGNVYEDHAFFDFCDRNGVMVWQDFAMACRLYPETDRFKKLLEAEATAVVKKLRNHPSIILWSGDNEIDLVRCGFTDPNCNTLTREVLPKVVNWHDIGRPYLASSPYVSPDMYRKKGDLPEDHLWGPRDYYKSNYYKNSTAHFVSETGYHGCPALSSIQKFITPERVWPYHNNPEWILHSSNQVGNDARVMLMEKQVRVLFGEVPTDPEDYILASQISQAEAKKYFIERIRVGRPHKTGVIWWNLLDGWPQMSDAVVDYYFTKKLAYGYIKRVQAPFVLAADEPTDGKLTLYACNDMRDARSGSFTVKDADSGEVLQAGTFDAAANTTTLIALLCYQPDKHPMLIFEWQMGAENGFNHYVCQEPPLDLQRYKAWIQKYRL